MVRNGVQCHVTVAADKPNVGQVPPLNGRSLTLGPMLWTRTFIATLKETPEGAEIPSHVLMLRAGLIHQVMAGAYAYLPLGLRSLRKAEQIVRGEMDRTGALEIAVPCTSPTSLWQQSGRSEAFGELLITFSLARRNRRVRTALAPAHEEIITEMLSRHIASYRQLPIAMYQIGPKFHNQPRPRFGLLRTTEFLTKDAFSFHATAGSLDECYDGMYAAYRRIFDRLGLNCLAIEAESEAGGDADHEFAIPAENGDDTLLHCAECGYAASRQRAEIGARDLTPPKVPSEAIHKVDTPDATTIEHTLHVRSRSTHHDESAFDRDRLAEPVTGVRGGGGHRADRLPATVPKSKEPRPTALLVHSRRTHDEQIVGDGEIGAEFISGP